MSAARASMSSTMRTAEPPRLSSCSWRGVTVKAGLLDTSLPSFWPCWLCCWPRCRGLRGRLALGAAACWGSSTPAAGDASACEGRWYREDQTQKLAVKGGSQAPTRTRTRKSYLAPTRRIKSLLRPELQASLTDNTQTVLTRSVCLVSQIAPQTWLCRAPWQIS